MTDEELASRSASKDGDAYRILVNRHVDRVYAYCARVTGNPSDAEDLVQDVFLRVWRNADRWDGGRLPFEAWLMVLARRICIDYLRRKKVRPTRTLDDEMLPDPLPGPHELAQARGVARRVQSELMKLPVNQRSAIVLRYYRGYSNEEAAAILGVTVYALESLLKRGRANLQRALGDLEKWQ
ncbi:MAG: sigma-70 family RNA polymerase sigma factor [Parvibaculum sp.]|uniref:RNA polymerase sigma factor n=1 Tax=Parvibaculum sp. TaxID=2024848 RepID=UPI001B11F2B0|nr:sigma-70 family RNA polymerase sigma factor [Parvibaculum sp.]MBO6635935.1 sigma-70 family RNA polymerase sigma factor [Parvibaculum sp.]